MCNYIVVRYVVGDVSDDILDVAAEILRGCDLLSVERSEGRLAIRCGGHDANYDRLFRDVVASSALLADLLRDAIFVAATVVALRSMGFDVSATLLFDGSDYRFSLTASRGDGGVVTMDVRGGSATMETSNFGMECVPLTRRLVSKLSNLGCATEIVSEVLKDEALGSEETYLFESESEYERV